MQGNFSQRLSSLNKKLSACHLSFNKNAFFLRKKIFSKKLENSPHVEFICVKEKEVESLFNRIKSAIVEFDNIYKDQ